MQLKQWLSTQVKSVENDHKPGLLIAVLRKRISIYLGSRFLFILILILMRTAVHYFRFTYVNTHFPLIELREMADWILGAALIEAFFYGLNEDIRQKSREIPNSRFSELLPLVRKRKWQHLSMIIVLFIYVAIDSWFPLLTSDRVFSVFDAVEIILLMKLMMHLFFLPDFAMIQGESRLHFKRWQFYLPEVLTALTLSLMTLLFGAWGVIFHFGLDLILREFLRIFILKETQKNLSCSYSLYKLSGFNVKEFFIDVLKIKNWIFGILQLLFRVETLFIIYIYRSNEELGLSLFLLNPFLRLGSDFIRLFIFDRLKIRNFLDRFAAKKIRFPLLLSSLVVSLLTGYILKLVLESLDHEVPPHFIYLPILFSISAWFSMELYSFFVSRLYSKNGKKIKGFYLCELTTTQLLLKEKIDLDQNGIIFFGKGRKIYIPSIMEDSKDEKIKWIQYFKGVIKKISWQTEFPKMLSKENAYTVFKELIPEGVILEQLPSNSDLEDQELTHYLRQYLEKGTMGVVILSGKKYKVTAGIFHGNPVIFLDPTRDESLSREKWKSLIESHSLSYKLKSVRTCTPT